MKLGLLGGTFDPPHRGHLKLALAARRQLKLDRVILIPARRSPFKMGTRPAPDALRVRMLRAAIGGRRGLSIDQAELRRAGPSYTVTTLRRYARRRPSAELFFIVGSDSLPGFGRWKNADEIVRRATLVAGRRPGAASAKAPARFRRRVVVLKGLFPDVAATRLRSAVRAGRPIAGLVAPAVARIIRQKGLYRA